MGCASSKVSPGPEACSVVPTGPPKSVSAASVAPIGTSKSGGNNGSSALPQHREGSPVMPCVADAAIAEKTVAWKAGAAELRTADAAPAIPDEAPAIDRVLDLKLEVELRRRVLELRVANATKAGEVSALREWAAELGAREYQLLPEALMNEPDGAAMAAVPDTATTMELESAVARLLALLSHKEDTITALERWVAALGAKRGSVPPPICS